MSGFSPTSATGEMRILEAAKAELIAGADPINAAHDLHALSQFATSATVRAEALAALNWKDVPLLDEPGE